MVPGTISGPVFSNGAWNFGTTGNYIFTDTVGSASPTAGYQFSNGCAAVGAHATTTVTRVQWMNQSSYF